MAKKTFDLRPARAAAIAKHRDKQIDPRKAVRTITRALAVLIEAVDPQGLPPGKQAALDALLAQQGAFEAMRLAKQAQDAENEAGREVGL